MGSTTLFNAVFIRPEQVVRFLLCNLGNCACVLASINNVKKFCANRNLRKSVSTTFVGCFSFAEDIKRVYCFIFYSPLGKRNRQSEINNFAVVRCYIITPQRKIWLRSLNECT